MLLQDGWLAFATTFAKASVVKKSYGQSVTADGWRKPLSINPFFLSFETESLS